jgi:hypothetical protein
VEAGTSLYQPFLPELVRRSLVAAVTGLRLAGVGLGDGMAAVADGSDSGQCRAVMREGPVAVARASRNLVPRRAEMALSAVD